MQSVSFSFHGIGVMIKGNPEIIEAAKHDFAFFLDQQVSLPCLTVECISAGFDYDSLPLMYSSLATPRNITFRKGTKTYIDYFGKAMNIFDANAGTCQIYAADTDLAREIVYLSVLANVSLLLEKNGLHRIHGLGLAIEDTGLIILLPAGGGKSTLAMQILRDTNNGIRLISEDSPLLNNHNLLLPFPLRIGVSPDFSCADIQPQYLRYTKRMEHPPKVTINIRQFSKKLQTKPVKAKIVLLGNRSTGKDASIVPTESVSSLKHVLLNSAIGIGLYQGMEFLMHAGMAGLLKNTPLFLKRLYCNLALAAQAHFYTFTIGRDNQRNYATLLDFLSTYSSAKKQR